MTSGFTLGVVCKGEPEMPRTPEEKTIKVVKKTDLLEIRKFEKDNDFSFNQMFTDEAIEAMDPNLRMPVSFHFVHNEDHIRCLVVVDEEGRRGLVDMTFEIFGNLEEVDIEKCL